MLHESLPYPNPFGSCFGFLISIFNYYSSNSILSDPSKSIKAVETTNCWCLPDKKWVILSHTSSAIYVLVLENVLFVSFWLEL